MTLSFVGFAWRNVWRRRLRTALTLCGIGMGIGAFVALVGFSRSFEHAWLEMYENAGTDLAVVQKTFLNTSVDQSVGPTLLKIPQIARAAPMVVNMMAVTPEINTLVYGWKADTFEFSALKILSGRIFHDGQQEVMLGELLAGSLNKKVGDTLDLQGSNFKVVGIFRSGSALEAGAIIMPLDELQQLSSLTSKVTAFHVQLKPAPAGVSAQEWEQQAENAVASELPGLRAVPAAQRAANNQLVALAHAAAWGTSLIALLVAALGIANTMAMSVFERTKEIGVLRAIGWSRRRVMGLILVEAAALGAAGGVAGTALGWLALHILGALPQTASIASTTLSTSTLVDGLVMAILVGVVAGAVPAWRGAQLSPVEALRHE
ncbi:MAG TPA: ABC transporter permease [Acidobacteriaceae bacterium]|jgi:putative ABC transport system permease protein|nr:ABC transporter permease [Acidobacteriaceae bacterium]